MHCVLDELLRVVDLRMLLQVNDEVDWLVPMELLRPAQDALRCVIIEILFGNGDGALVLKSWSCVSLAG
jgi:hypothetical protein